MDISSYMASGTAAVGDLAGDVVLYGLQIVGIVIGVGALFFIIKVGWRKIRGNVT